jgi:hypothetical protein
MRTVNGSLDLFDLSCGSGFLSKSLNILSKIVTNFSITAVFYFSKEFSTPLSFLISSISVGIGVMF